MRRETQNISVLIKIFLDKSNVVFRVMIFTDDLFLFAKKTTSENAGAAVTLLITMNKESY
jgi:hypothetical protein